VAAAYRAACPDVSVLFFGRPSGFEQRLIDAQRDRFEALPAAPFYGVSTWGRRRTLSQLWSGIRCARRALARDGVHLVIGFGGYASAAAVLAARSLGIATAVHEANAVPGLTNRLLGRVVDRVLIGWDGAAHYFRTGHSGSTGTPIRTDLAALARTAHRAPDAARLRLLICGGSQGSAFLNRQVPELAGMLRRDGRTVEVRHLSGRERPQDVHARYAAHGVTADVQAYTDDMAVSYGWADLAIACAGAATLAELSAAGLPALLVPLAAASDDHQAANAAAFAAATGVPWVREAAWDVAVVGRQLAALLGDRAAWTALSERTRRFARPDAAAAVVAECEALFG
jgi:UDP-N-acetylglucosamine--N-acetylmuramyl-(pentapeptide) pyrophosphoryl-undecaprenol N-acetylglucosamine transferase